MNQQENDLGVPLEDEGRSTPPAGETPSVRLRPHATHTPTQEEFNAMRQAEEDLNFDDADDEPEAVVIGYYCLACGHTQGRQGWDMQCDRCCGPLDEMYE